MARAGLPHRGYAPGTGDVQLTLAQQFRPQGALIVTTPQQVAVADAEKALTMFQMPLVQVPVLGVIENMAYFLDAAAARTALLSLWAGRGAPVG